jgi:hypothetical protein
MKVSTVAAETDTFYIDSLDPTTSRGSFLELGGWNDKALAHEDGVTAATQNAYSDRDAIDGRYDHDLKESRFWYHAEVIDTARLQAVAAAQWAPDLSLVLAQIDRPALLCYYLFFPAHVQSIACTETSGIEVSSHAGDWQCVAILLDGDLNGDAALLNPRYFGLTGTRPTDFKAYGFDDDELTAMKAYEWKRPGPGVDELPHTVVGPNAGLHPQVYVSLGSHSLYVDAFDHAVDPYPDSVPHDCGNSDGVGILPPSPTVPDVDSIPDSEAWPNALKVWGAFLLKLITGATAGGKVGGLQGSVAGGAAGAVSGVAEIANSLDTSPFGYGGDPNVDKPKGDVGPPFRTGTTIKPAAVTAPGAGTTVVPWQVAQNAVIGGRAGHDYVVDRNLQKWWPDDTGEHGYLGRWGQRVADDTLPRRSGPRFPNYARMFLTALAHLGDT